MPSLVTHEDLAERLTRIEEQLKALQPVAQLATELVVLAEGYKAASLVGRLVRWVAGLLAAISAIWWFRMGGEPPRVE